MSQCNDDFDRIAGALGDFSCHDAPAIVHLRSPFALSNWTLPVLELTIVIGAVLALWWAIRRLRRDNDPTNLVLWFAATVYLLVVELPLYFPDMFGVQDTVGVVFDHNVFTVQLLYDRLPLYIVAFYPALTMLAFEIVRALGVFRDRGIVVGAICVGFVHHCFYEVFDQLGPQLRWWAWNTDNVLNRPMLASVPVTSVVIFAALGPVVLTLLVQLLVGRNVERGKTFRRGSLWWRTVAAGALVPPGVALLSLPASLFGGPHPHITVQAIIYSAELAMVAVIAVPVLIHAWLRLRDGKAPGAQIPNAFVRLFGPLYLVVLAVLWLTALPAYFGAVNGITADDTPTGSLGYAAVSFAFAAILVFFAAAGSHARRAATAVDGTGEDRFPTDVGVGG